MTGNVKKIIFGAVVIFALFIIWCLMGVDDSEKAIKKLVEGYCETIKEFNLDNTDQYIAFESDYWVDMNENVFNTFVDVFKDSISNMEYTIEDIKVDEDQEIFSWANVTVRFRFLDYSKVMSDSLERFEYEVNNMPFDSSDEEIYHLLYEIFVEEQEIADEIWNDIAIDFLLAKNRDKPNPKWFITDIPEDISIILTCNTETSFEKYGVASNEGDMDESEVAAQETGIENEDENRNATDLNVFLGALYSIYDGDCHVSLYLDDAGKLCVWYGNEGADEAYYTQTYDAYAIEDHVLYGYAGDFTDEFDFLEDGIVEGHVEVLLAGYGSNHYQTYIREEEYFGTNWREAFGFE